MKAIFNKYNFNKLLWLVVVGGIFLLYWLALNQAEVWYQWLGVYFGLVFLSYYNLNLLHIISHRGLAKKTWLNHLAGSITAFLAGFSFQVFTQVHLQHHKHFGNDEKDPDHRIVQDGRFYFIPFRVWYQDYFFWKSGLAKQNFRWLEYILVRLAQVLALFLLWRSGNFWLWTNIWLPVMLLEGYLFGMFQFYFPHYTSWDGIFANTKLAKIWAWVLDVCRTYHDAHHLRVTKNVYYFPVENWFWDEFNKRI